MLGNKHLHIDQDDQLSNWLSGGLASVKRGALTIFFADAPAAKITAQSDTIAVDLLRPDMFKITDDETGLFDKLRTAAEFGRKLSDNDVTLCFLRRGKEVVRLGRDAKPTFSKLITRSDDIQVNSVREFAKLKGEFKTD